MMTAQHDGLLLGMAASTGFAEAGAAFEADRQIVLTRVFAAPRDLVWQAWTDARHVDQWWGPNGFRNQAYEMDVRPGGVWRYIMHGPDGTDYDNRIVYHDVVQPERLVYTHSSDIDNDPDSFHVTITFEAHGDKTQITMRSLFATAAQRDATIAFGAIEGGTQTLGRLAEYLTAMNAGEGE
ncbi:MAG: SRPBCC family protein [Roseiflexaceae bacterium]|nr:SRPBCC family protein [Roseiflexaceae bacterium]